MVSAARTAASPQQLLNRTWTCSVRSAHNRLFRSLGSA